MIVAEKAKVAINNRLKSTDKLIESPGVVNQKEFLKQQQEQQHPFRQVHTYYKSIYRFYFRIYGQILNTKLGLLFGNIHSKLCRYRSFDILYNFGFVSSFLSNVFTYS